MDGELCLCSISCKFFFLISRVVALILPHSSLNWGFSAALGMSSGMSLEA